MKCGVSVQVKVYLREVDGTRKLVYVGRNAMGADLLGMLHYWNAYDAQSVPVAHVGFTYSTTEVFESTDNDGPTAVGSTGYKMTGTAEWTNNTGESKTITDLRLTSSNAADPQKEYGTLGSLSQVVGIGATLEVVWTLTLQRNASGGSTIELAFFSRLCNRLIEAQSTAPLKTAKFTADNAGYTTVDLGDPDSGGEESSDHVTWVVSPTAPAGASTLAEIALYDEDPLLVDDQTGFSDSWAEGKQITDTITMTWTEVP